jgi:transposase
MASRSGAVHVATTRRHYKGKVYETHLLRRTYREDGKVKHETLGNISHLPPDLIEFIRRRLHEGKPIGLPAEARIVRSLPHGHVAAVLGTIRATGLDRLIGSRRSAERELVIAMVAARILEPASKLATLRGLSEQTASSTLGMELGIEADDERELYAAMDWLLKRQSRIEEKIAAEKLTDGSLVLYDVSSSYYTGRHCSLASYGHSRDGRREYPQIVYGLLCNGEGCPVAVEVFEGSTADPATLSAQVERVRKRFAIERVIFVGDRGMITSRRIEEELRGVAGLEWITALRSPAIKSLVEQEVIEPSLFDEQDLVEVHSPDYPGERLVVCRNPLLAADRARKREELLQATERDLEAVAAATARAKRPLRGKENIGLQVGRRIDKHKVGKHFLLEISEEAFSYRRDEQKIAQEAALDGLYVIRTSVPSHEFSAEAAVRAYKDLSKVEQAFRCIKTVDLKVRPIYHRLDERVRAHVFLCMLAYYVEWHMRGKLKPLLFEEEDLEGAEELRASIVAPAQRSESARRKESTKRNEEGLPVHSFQSLLSDLTTLSKNQICRGGQSSETFWMLTEPTPLQARAFELLGVRP